MGTWPQAGPIQVPNPSDTRLHFESYQNMAKMLNQMRGMTVGNTREVINNIVHVKLSSVVTDAITGDEVTWDYAAEEFVTMEGGRDFDGTEFPYLIPANGNWLPAVGDVVVVYEVIDNTDAESRWIFYPLAKLNNSFVPSIDEEDNTLLRIQTGTVYLNEEDDGTDVTDGTGFSLSSDAYLVVKWTMPLSDGTAVQTPTVTTTVQTESVEPNFIDIGASEVTFKWVIGQILSDEYTSWWWGDIHHNFPCTPQYHDDVQTAGDDQSVDLFAVSEATTISQTSGIVNFLEGRIVGHQFKVGDLFNIVDNGSGSNEYQFGGISASIDYDTIDFDDSEENKISITTKNIVASTVAGLVQSWTQTDNSEDLIKYLGKWVGKEANGNVKHLNSPATSTSDDEHWFRVTFTISGGISIDGSSAVDSITLYFDTKGHLWKYNSTTQPDPDENYRYSPCPGVSGSDIIVSATQGTIVELDNKCYTSVGTTEEALTSPAPSVGNTFTTCASCTSSQSNEIWRDCPSPGTTDYVVQGTPSSDIAPALWGCVTSAWKKMYYDNRMSSNSATVTDFLAQCGTTAEDCDDLVGWPGSDDFGGTGCNSGAVNDTNYDIRWSETKVGTPTYSVSGGNLNVDIDEAAASIPVRDFFTGTGTDSGSIGDATWDKRWTKVIYTNDVASDSITGNNLVSTVNPQATESQVISYDINLSSNHSGDFYFEVPLTVANVNNTGGPNGYLWLTVGGVFHFIGYEQSSSGDGWFWRVGSTYHNFDSSLNGTKTLIIQRVGSTITFKDGTTTLGTNTNSGNVSIVRFSVGNVGGGTQITQDVTFTFDYLEALDGVGGDPIEITQTASESSITLANNIPSQSGDFYAGVNITVDSVTGTGGGPNMALIFGTHEVGYIQNGSGVSGWYTFDGSTYTQHSTGVGTNLVEISRTGSTLTMDIDGVQKFSGTYAASAVPELRSSNFESTTTNTDGIDGSYGIFVVSDDPTEPSPNPIYIDPTGDPCP